MDGKRTIPGYRARRGRFDVMTVPAMPFLMIDGHGDPNTAPEYAAALTTIYPVAYALKFLGKSTGRDHVVMPLEALWWADDLAAFTAERDKSRWDWTVMITVPEWVTAEHVDVAREKVRTKDGVTRLPDIRLETFDEGLAVQTLHVGSYDAEAPVLDELHQAVIPGLSLRMTGKHHEVYLSDARRTAPEKLRTILRQPVEHI
ncbi:GyrI-like domain-containing protein [Nakamurella flava]|nr:GyrI-like domain-containing protein [Nakamurella flava]